jgi:hypothetical protein
MAYRLILLMGSFFLFGFASDRLADRRLEGVGSIALPARVAAVGKGEAWDDDPSRLYFRFAREYGWLASLGSSTAYRQIITVSLLAPDAGSADYERWPPRFEPLYSKLAKERTVALGQAHVAVSAGRYAQNALDEPAHVYVYVDPARRLQITWPRMAASFRMTTDPRARFTEMRGRGASEQQRAMAAVKMARDALATAGFAAAAPGKPVHARGVYVEWMDDPEPRFQLLKPLGLVRQGGSAPLIPRRQGGAPSLRGSVGWRRHDEGAWVSDNRDNAYLPLPGIEQALALRHTDVATTLYYYATTVRVEKADADTIQALGFFFQELPAIERAWQQGELVDAERHALPEAPPRATLHDVTPTALPPLDDRQAFGIALDTGTPSLDALRRRLATAARGAWPDVRAGRFDAAEAALRAVDQDIQSAVMLGAMYTAALQEAVQAGEQASRPQYVAALHERALHWRLSAYPEPYTAYEADDYAAGRAGDRAQLDAVMAGGRQQG